MDTITIRLTSKWPPNPTSPIIARLSGSRLWSHSMAIIDGFAFEATMLHGCRVVAVDKAMEGVALYQDMQVPISDKRAAVEWGREQDGKPYDFAGALGLPLLMSEDWADDSKWWCSELCFMQVWRGGTALFDPAVAKRITPAHLAMCNFPKSPLIRL